MIITPKTRRRTVVHLKNTGGILTQSPAQSPTTIKSSVLVSTPSTRFDRLSDVTETSQADGAVPQYNSQTDTYEVKPLVLDGGTF